MDTDDLGLGDRDSLRVIYKYQRGETDDGSEEGSREMGICFCLFVSMWVSESVCGLSCVRVLYYVRVCVMCKCIWGKGVKGYVCVCLC